MTRQITSALVTCYNKADFIVQCVEALVECKEIDSITVYNDASTDNSLYLLQQTFKGSTKVEILNGATNMGVAYSRNFLLNHVDADIIVFVDGDDIVKPLVKDSQIKAFRDEVDYVLSYSDYQRKSGSNFKFIGSGSYSYNRLKTHNFIPFSSVILRRNPEICFDTIHHEDYMLWLGYLNKLPSKSINYFEEATFIYNDTGNSLSSNVLKGILSNYRIKRRAGIGLIESCLRTLMYMIIVSKKRWI